jgi:hypothetical protein
MFDTSLENNLRSFIDSRELLDLLYINELLQMTYQVAKEETKAIEAEVFNRLAPFQSEYDEEILCADDVWMAIAPQFEAFCEECDRAFRRAKPIGDSHEKGASPDLLAKSNVRMIQDKIIEGYANAIGLKSPKSIYGDKRTKVLSLLGVEEI